MCFNYLLDSVIIIHRYYHVHIFNIVVVFHINIFRAVISILLYRLLLVVFLFNC